MALLVALSLAACGTWDPTAEPAPDPTRSTVLDVGDADDPGSTGGQAELTVGDGTFNVTVTECVADPDGGVRVTGETEDGMTVTGLYDPEAPDDARVVVTNAQGQQVYTSDRTSGDAAPEFTMTEDGFRAVGTFVSDAGEDVEGSLSGTC